MRRLGILFTCLITLNACVTVQEQTLPPDSEIGKQAAWEVHRVNLEVLHVWSLKGRVAGRSNNEGFRAGVRWRQQQHIFDIDLHGPLGRKVAVIKGKEGDVQLTTSKGESYSAADPEDLMQDLFGYSLPVNGLRYWMRGIPDPQQKYASLELDKQGRLKQLNQAGWLIDYNRYHDGEPAMPAFIKITNQVLDANIVIDHWSLNAIN
ncbi:MAG: lipoprotein insertase outer membrane protein LolB [Gammaproteobacteria bacterium]